MRNPWLLVLWGVLLGASPSINLITRLQKAEARLEAMRTGIRDGAYPHPIGCARFQGAPWEGFVSLGDTWPKDEPRPMVCHLKFEVERLGLVPKG